MYLGLHRRKRMSSQNFANSSVGRSNDCLARKKSNHTFDKENIRKRLKGVWSKRVSAPCIFHGRLFNWSVYGTPTVSELVVSGWCDLVQSSPEENSNKWMHQNAPNWSSVRHRLPDIVNLSLILIPYGCLDSLGSPITLLFCLCSLLFTAFWVRWCLEFLIIKIWHKKRS